MTSMTTRVPPGLKMLLDEQRKVLTEDEVALMEMVRGFADEQIAPIAGDIDRNGRIPTKILREMAGLGLMGVILDEEHGGIGLGNRALAIVIKEISRACASCGVLLSVHASLGSWVVKTFGSEAMRARVLPHLASGKRIICYSLSEHGAGSDPAALQCSFTWTDDSQTRFRIRGKKAWVTSFKEAFEGRDDYEDPIEPGYCVLFGTFDKTARHRGVACALVPFSELSAEMRAKIIIGKTEDKLGIRGSSTCEVDYEDLELDSEWLIANAGDGFKIAMDTLDGGRIGIASQAWGIHTVTFEEALRYAANRRQFGSRIGDFGDLMDMLDQMWIASLSMQELIFKAAEAKDLYDRIRAEGGDLDPHKYSHLSAAAKLLASTAAVRDANNNIQIHGGVGYTTDYPAERRFRDARITEIYEGTTQVQKLVLARALLGKDQD